MPIFVYERAKVYVPEWVVDLESFRRWTDADDFPDIGHIYWLQGEVWVDMSREQLFTHGQVKTRVATALDTLVHGGNLGWYWGDGPLLSNEDAELSVVPDGIFVSRASVEAKRVRLLEGLEQGHVEIEGSPDMVLEVVSASSVAKDTEVLREVYWKAGVLEYWLIDARSPPLRFEILRHTPKGFAPTRKAQGWLKSAVFGRSFRLTQEVGPLGHPSYTLEQR